MIWKEGVAKISGFHLLTDRLRLKYTDQESDSEAISVPNSSDTKKALIISHFSVGVAR